MWHGWAILLGWTREPHLKRRLAAECFELDEQLLALNMSSITLDRAEVEMRFGFGQNGE